MVFLLFAHIYGGNSSVQLTLAGRLEKTSDKRAEREKRAAMRQISRRSLFATRANRRARDRD